MLYMMEQNKQCTSRLGPLAQLGPGPSWAYWSIWARVPFGPLAIGPIGPGTHILTFREGPRLFLQSMYIQIYMYIYIIYRERDIDIGLGNWKVNTSTLESMKSSNVDIYIYHALFLNMLPYELYKGLFLISAPPLYPHPNTFIHRYLRSHWYYEYQL